MTAVLALSIAWASIILMVGLAFGAIIFGTDDDALAWDEWDDDGGLEVELS